MAGSKDSTDESIVLLLERTVLSPIRREEMDLPRSLECHYPIVFVLPPLEAHKLLDEWFVIDITRFGN